MVLEIKDKHGIRDHMSATEWGSHLEELNVNLFVASTVYADEEVYLNMLWDMLNLSVLGFTPINAKEQINFIKALTNVANSPRIGKLIKEYINLNPINVTSRIQYAVWILALYNKITGGEPMKIEEYVNYLTNDYVKRADAIKFSLDQDNNDDETEEETNPL